MSERAMIGVDAGPERELEAAGSRERPGLMKRGVDRPSVRLRALLLGVPLVVLDNFWVVWMEHVSAGPHPTVFALFANTIFILAILVLLNRLVHRVRPRASLSQAELLLVYVMLCIGASIACYDWLPIAIQMMTHPFWLATAENRWMELFGAHLPLWLMMDDPLSLENCYKGGSSIYLNTNYMPWLLPSAWWTAFLMVMIYVMMCINVIVRKQWVDNERLTFPIVQLPLAMTEPRGSFWRNRLLWTGFGLAAAISTINGFSTLFPAVPMINVRGIDVAGAFTSKPWNAMGWMPFTAYPFIIGLAFLLPTELLFSTWFFFLLSKGQIVAASARGLDAIPEFPYAKQQSVGAFMAIFVVIMWTSRGYLKQIWRHIVAPETGNENVQEAMSYRSAAIGAAIGVLLMSWFFSVIGLPPVLALLAFGVFLVLATVVTRLRAELGPATHDLYLFGPDDLLTQTVGTSNMTTRTLTAMTFLFWFNRSQESQPMAHGLEGMKMADSSRGSQRWFMWAIMIAALVGCISTFWAYLHFSYSVGAAHFADGYGFNRAQGAYDRLDIWINNPIPPRVDATLANGAGFGFCIVLGALRMRFCGWPFHPIGYAMAGIWATKIIWGPFLIAWVLKIAVLRYGGHKLYRAAVPLFLGLVLGDLVLGMLWSLVGMVFGIKTYSFCL